MTMRLVALALALVLQALVAQSQSAFKVLPKSLEPVPASGTLGHLDVPPEETPGFQRLKVGASSETDPWSVIIVTPDGVRYEIDRKNLSNYIVYDDVIEIPVWVPGRVSVSRLGTAPPTLKRESVVVRLPAVENKFPQGNFNLEPVGSWSGDLLTHLRPAMALLRTTSTGETRPCSATQIAPRIFLTALHCISHVVDAECRLKNSGKLWLLFGPNLVDASGKPTKEALESAIPASPVFCGTRGGDGIAWPMDFAIVFSSSQIARSNWIAPEAADLKEGTYLQLSAYLSEPASGRKDNGSVDYVPDLYLSRDADCRVPLNPVNPAQGGCPYGHVAHRCDTWETMSGGAVLRRGSARLVAVHYFYAGSDNCALPWPIILQQMKATAKTPLQREVLTKFQ